MAVKIVESKNYTKKTIMVGPVQFETKSHFRCLKPASFGLFERKLAKFNLLIVSIVVVLILLLVSCNLSVICTQTIIKSTTTTTNDDKMIAYKQLRSDLHRNDRYQNYQQYQNDDAYTSMLLSQPLERPSLSRSVQLKGENQREPEAMALGALMVGERPKLIPLVAAESGYNENSSVNILCTVSSGHHESLLFDWFKDGQVISDSMFTTRDNNLQNNNFANSENNNNNNNFNGIGNLLVKPIQVDKHADHSLLRISQVQSWHSGRYTCSAKNQFGSDSSSVSLRVNGKL